MSEVTDYYKEKIIEMKAKGKSGGYILSVLGATLDIFLSSMEDLNKKHGAELRKEIVGLIEKEV